MGDAEAIREFLMTRRDKVQPEQVGLPRGARRRVSGLRREEVAALAGVSAEYYVQIERGRLAGVSDDVLAAIARALLLDEAETTHLFDLARAETGAPVVRRRSPRRPSVPVAVQAIIDAMAGAVAVVQDELLDVVAANALGRIFYREAHEAGERPNLARYLFLDDRSRDFFEDWEHTADDAVAMLRLAAGRAPRRDLTDLVGELATRSQEFASRWSTHDVKVHRIGTKHVHHRDVGPLVLQYAALDVPSAPGLTIFGYTPAPSEPATADAMRILASLAATIEEPSHRGG